MIEQEVFVNSTAEQLSMILGHVIRNAQDATDSGGFIDVSLSQNENTAIIEVEDNGIGMSQEFVRERLFKPFDSTKASKGMGIGAYQTREFIRHAGGDVEIISEEGKGTTFCILLPLAEQQSVAKIA
jgi:signal transduction histidine kinase